MVYKFRTSAFRSGLMQKIKSEKTKPEIAFQNALRKEKIKFRSYNEKLPGKPDIVLLKNKIVIFIAENSILPDKYQALKKERLKKN